MKIYYIGILRSSGDKALELTSARDLSQFSFFERNGVSQFMTFSQKPYPKRTQPDRDKVLKKVIILVILIPDQREFLVSL